MTAHRRRPFRLILSILLWSTASASWAACTNLSFLNPVNEVDWDCVFPITIAGIPIDMGDHPPDDNDSTMTCECAGKGPYGTPLFGFQVSYWEPSHIMDTVADAWCFPAIGLDMTSNESGYSTSSYGYTGGGSSIESFKSAQNQIFQHYHYYIYPVWEIIGMFTDSACEEDDAEFDIGMVSEVRSDWSDDMTAMQLYPETKLMANQADVLACIADAVGATVGHPIDALYWCMGAWGLTYPMTGNITAKDPVEANAGDAARALYSLTRFGLVMDRATDVCSDTYSLIWTKSHYRFQEVRPVDESQCHVIGSPGLLWTWHKNPVGFSDNFSWLIFDKVKCCVGIY